jgi:cytochrome c-type biogenesis protein CcmE
MVAWLFGICLGGSLLFLATGQQIDFIRHGTDAPAGKYPYFVGIHIRSYGLICGGTLIHPSGTVLTVRI